MNFFCMIWVVSRNNFGFLVWQFEMLIVVHYYSKNNNKLQEIFYIKI